MIFPPMAFNVHWFLSTGGQCPSVVNVSAVQSGLGFNVTAQAGKLECSGWEDTLYHFSIMCATNCTGRYRDSGNSSVPMWVFPDVGIGVFVVTVIAENSCEEQTVLAQKQISVGEPYTWRCVNRSRNKNPPTPTQWLHVSCALL